VHLAATPVLLSVWMGWARWKEDGTIGAKFTKHLGRQHFFNFSSPETVGFLGVDRGQVQGECTGTWEMTAFSVLISGFYKDILMQVRIQLSVYDLNKYHQWTGDKRNRPKIPAVTRRVYSLCEHRHGNKSLNIHIDVIEPILLTTL